ncbi:MAG: hypothetical protein HN657_03400 [Candidatus Marinimicrobia bacterium]|jgi:antitoxin component YwqK of YwqJK toxin-antitoxin module|nr:hypothetical protein [Candidatus Neomarinimicrobiota bacterium]MBT3496507.1 hypothetical protein [Candidatus Neomarinimicrobiota bacterium]MBT3691920.1 hypothetical protein [Candidatus Neomarinimicrobiota bacterium]MBT3732049.1 hypothetical protein [Candidatus Neomarinimicrobiota bacterium]MBT4144221.1 hypothetical protein [Candidatus Neomarinimicrobiota bacterium]
MSKTLGKIGFLYLYLIIFTIGYGQDISCSEIAQYYDNGTIEFCRLAKADTISGQIFPKGTGVHFTKEGSMNWCFLPEDMMIQGHYCLGGGHSFMTGFYPNGQLKTAWLVQDEIIQEIPCSKFRFFSAIFHGFHGKDGSTNFYNNGQLMYCELSRDITIQGQSFKIRDSIRFDRSGKLILSKKPLQ